VGGREGVTPRVDGMASDARGPRDDFYCWKFEIWYPSEDCIYRHSNQTYAACTGCFQGRLNLRYAGKGLPPPVVLTGDLKKESA
jgi:hypothetical protein